MSSGVAISTAVAVVLSVWLLSVMIGLWWCRHELVRLWREPVFRHPILIVESDDWGAGPLAQAPALRQIAEVLQCHRDGTGRMPVMSLALVLAVPDGPEIRATGVYRAVELDDPRLAPILQALLDGAARGVFALQLHGLEHYWPATLLAIDDPAVRGWLLGEVPATTEQLPSHLQSRWVDASNLPSSPLPVLAVHAAAQAEVKTYARIFGELPRVVVPPTFVWTRETERAWAAAGLEHVVTPGWRYPQRDARGRASGDEGPIVSGDREEGLVYLVRSDYFEPARGRDARHALGVLERMTAEGRPCLLENHRDNFIGEPPARRHALTELDTLYREALQRHPGLRFMSTLELGRIARDCDPEWLFSNWRECMPARWRRLRWSGRPWKLACLTGVSLFGALVVRAASRPVQQRAA
jgi:hypothetical protein